MPKAAKGSTAKKAAPARKAATTAKKSTATASTPKKAASEKPTPKPAKASAKKAAAKATGRAPERAKPAGKAAKGTKGPGPAKATPATKAAARPKKVVLDKFLLEQQALLREERATYTQQADDLLAEANQLAAEAEPGDVQFDEESGEGGTTNIDRERDLALVAQARNAIEEIDFALEKIENGTYGLCETCGQPIVKARLKAIPYARQCIQCKSGGLGRR